MRLLHRFYIIEEIFIKNILHPNFIINIDMQEKIVAGEALMIDDTYKIIRLEYKVRKKKFGMFLINLEKLFCIFKSFFL